MATDLNAIFRFAARSAPDGRAALIIALGAHVGRTSAHVPANFQLPWMVIATTAIIVGFLMLIWRSIKASRAG